MKPGPLSTGWILLAAAMLLGSCAAPKPCAQIALKPGSPWPDVAKAGGPATVKFSYVTGGQKYDLASLENSPNPVLFENSRLLAVLSPDTMSEFDRRIGEHLKTVELPFENGVSAFHSWLLSKSRTAIKPAEPAGAMVGEVAASAVILAPISPILLAGGVCAVTEHAMTGKERGRAAAVNEALLASGPSYGTFLSQFGRFDFHTAKGSYQIREYLATDGAFFTGRDFFYEIGFQNGKPVWVTYENSAVRSHAVRYWSAHR
jgi:hypothetical protein